MRSPTDRRRSRGLRPLLAFAALWFAIPAFAQEPAAPPAPIPDAEVERALEDVRKDPNLSAERTVRTLDWDPDPDEKKERRNTDLPGWLEWLGDLFMWIGQASRVLMWILIAVLVGLLATFLFRIFASGRDGFGRGTRFVAPTHVQDLDIRPESLPPDIGATARELWDRGEHRAALALLYRGMLSRLAHVHEVPIRDSSTEGDCLTLAARKLDATRVAYATRLVRTWQRAIYGGIQADTADVYALCAGFSQHLDSADSAAAPGSQPAEAAG